MRLFVAVEFDPALRRALARTRDQLPWLGSAVKPVAEELIHLTIRFVGETSDDRIGDVIDAAKSAAEAFAPFSFFVRGLGCFPRSDLARVLWAGIEPCPELTAIARQVESELVARGFPPDPRGFSPHVTLARAKGPPVRLRAPLDGERPRFGEQEVDALTVMESRLSPRGPTYVPIASAPLREETAPPEASP